MNNKKNYCRFCKSELKNIFLDLGDIPSANSFLNEDEIEQERKYPLCVYICKKCWGYAPCIFHFPGYQKK